LETLMFTILIIDDDAATRFLLGQVLKEQGYTILVASNGQEGIRLAEAHLPALIICDWVMKGLDGLSVCRHLKALPSTAISFFIVLTLRQSTDDRVKGLDAGADDFLTKPVDISELNARVRAGLRLYQASRDLQARNQRLEILSQDLQRQTDLLEAERAEAAKYVRSLMPSGPVPGLDIQTCFLPCQELGGDCFDYCWLDDDYFMIYLLDICGHGLAAALPSIAILNLLRAGSLPQMSLYNPASVLTALNQTFQAERENDKYFTLWYGVYSCRQRQLSYASAGHPPAILLSGLPGQADPPPVQRLRTPTMPIGLLEDTVYMNYTCTIPPGSQLYVFSDGVYEIQHRDRSLLGLDRWIDHLVQARQHAIGFQQLLPHPEIAAVATPYDDDVSLIQLTF
jgi:phosphoserine phosphatase RsbU/P